MKEDKYTKSLAKNQVYAIVHMRDRYWEKRFTQICKALYGDAMFVSLRGTNMAAENQRKHLLLSFPTYE